MISCFPRTQQLIFRTVTLKNSKIARGSSKNWLGDDMPIFDLASLSGVRQTVNQLLILGSNTSQPPPDLQVDANITLPFIFTKSYGNPGVVDRFLHRLKDLFEVRSQQSRMLRSESAPQRKFISCARILSGNAQNRESLRW